MAIRGSCLCGGITFEIDSATDRPDSEGATDPWLIFEAVVRGDVASLPAVLQSGDLDLYLHTRIRETSRNHRGCWPDVAEILAEYGPTLRKVAAVRQHINDSNHITQACFGLRKCGFDVLQTLFGLLKKTVGYRHVQVIEPGCAGNEDPIPLNHCAAIADLGLKGGSRTDQRAFHVNSRLSPVSY